MSGWTNYKGLQVPSATPTGDAGINLSADLESLADRVGPCNFTATTNPASSDDVNEGYRSDLSGVNTSISAWFVTNNTARRFGTPWLFTTLQRIWPMWCWPLASSHMRSIRTRWQLAMGARHLPIWALLSQYVLASLNINLLSDTPIISSTPLADIPGWIIGNMEDNYVFNDGAPIFVVGANDIVPTNLDSGYIATDGHGDVYIASDGTQAIQALTIYGPGGDIAAVNVQNMPVGTLASPPVGLQVGDLWLDTTTSATYPIVRSYI